MRDSNAVSPGLHLPIHSRWPNRYCTSKFLTRHRTPRHLLRGSPLPLRPIDGSSLCHRSRLYSLIPSVLRLHPSQHMDQNPLRSDVHRCQLNLLPATLPRTCRHAPPILRLPGRLHAVKHCIIDRVPNLISCRNHVPIYPLRSICRQTRSNVSRTHIHQYRVTPRLPSTLPHI